MIDTLLGILGIAVFIVLWVASLIGSVIDAVIENAPPVKTMVFFGFISVFYLLVVIAIDVNKQLTSIEDKLRNIANRSK